jgi:hypothetical protein
MSLNAVMRLLFCVRLHDGWLHPRNPFSLSAVRETIGRWDRCREQRDWN